MLILSINELKSIYYAVFSSHLNYASQIWGLSDTKYTDKIFKIQKNAVHLMTRAGFNAHTSSIFKSLEILKVHDQINLLNCLFVHGFLNGNLPKSFDNTFTKLSDIRSNDNTVSTINSELGCIFLPNVNTSTYGLNSLYRNSIISWLMIVKKRAKKQDKETCFTNLLNCIFIIIISSSSISIIIIT